MNVTYACPRCDAGVRIAFEADTPTLDCNHCGQQISISPESVAGDRLRRCLVCPSTDLYVRKDFPQRVGVALVVVGIVGSSIAWYYSNLLWTIGILFATALVDVLLYSIVGNALMCYRCHAQYRSVQGLDTHGHFDLETHEKYRQLAARIHSSQPNESAQ